MYGTLLHDLRRDLVDVDLMEVGYNVREDYALKHLHDWITPVHELAPLLMEPGHVRVRPTRSE